MSAVEKKKVIREQMRSQRQQLTAEQRSQAADELLNILSQALIDNDFPLAMYLPFDGKLDTHPFIEQAWQANRHIYLPVTREMVYLCCFDRIILRPYWWRINMVSVSQDQVSL